MRTLLTSAATALALSVGAASAQTAMVTGEGVEAAPDALVGQTVYAEVRTGVEEPLDAGELGGLRAIGVLEGMAADGGTVRIAMAEGLAPEGAAVAEVPAEHLGLVPVEPGRYAVVLRLDGSGIENRLIEAEQERLAEMSMAEGDLFEQGDAMSGTPIAEGTDGLDEEGRPIDPGVAEADDGADVVVVEAEPEPVVTDEVVVVDPEPTDELREVDIADADAPPIEDATNVIPADDAGQVTELKAETELTSPSHTAATTGEEVDLATAAGASATGMARPGVAPENFAVADMATMDVTELLGVRVYTMDDDQIGEIDRWVGEAPGRLPEGAVVEVGGFLGIGAREVAIDTDLMTLMADADGNDMRVYVEITEDQLGELPEVAD